MRWSTCPRRGTRSPFDARGVSCSAQLERTHRSTSLHAHGSEGRVRCAHRSGVDAARSATDRAHGAQPGDRHTPRHRRARLLARVERGIIGRVDHVVVISDEIDHRLHGWVPDERRTFVLPVSPERHPTRTPRRGARRVRHRRRRTAGGDRRPAPPAEGSSDVPAGDGRRGRRRCPTPRAVMVGDGPERRAIEAERTQTGPGRRRGGRRSSSEPRRRDAGRRRGRPHLALGGLAAGRRRVPVARPSLGDHRGRHRHPPPHRRRRCAA